MVPVVPNSSVKEVKGRLHAPNQRWSPPSQETLNTFQLPPPSTIAKRNLVFPKKKRKKPRLHVVEQVQVVAALPGRDLELEHNRRGRWSEEEHKTFLKLLREYGPSWTQISKKIKTRSEPQVRSHAQKYFLRKSRIDQALAEFAAEDFAGHEASTAESSVKKVQMKPKHHHDNDNNNMTADDDVDDSTSSKEDEPRLTPRTQLGSTSLKNPTVDQYLPSDSEIYDDANHDTLFFKEATKKRIISRATHQQQSSITTNVDISAAFCLLSAARHFPTSNY